jgi:Fe-coproporphyrin III synthase
MLRVSHFMQEILEPTPPAPSRSRSGPVVIWNLVRRCNLTCRHCYSISCDRDFPDELSTAEASAVMDDLKASGVPALILSGGEPLLRTDLFELAARAKSMGFYVGLSTNGTLIDDDHADRIEQAGFDYVGISLDGLAQHHDRFRRQAGAFERSLQGLRRCRDRGVKVGVRCTLTRENFPDIGALLELVEQERIERFYLSHLNYAGRGNSNRRLDAHFEMTRAAMDLLFDTCWQHVLRGQRRDYTTGNNDADGAWLLLWVQRRFPHRAAHLRARLAQWGGNASGVNVANIDNTGNVHPDTMWWHHTLGNVRRRPFSQIWNDLSDPLMAGLKQRPRPVGGRCAGCVHLDLCGGNTRVRAQQLTGDPWAEDPGCYLSDEEIGRAVGPAPAGRKPAVPRAA